MLSFVNNFGDQRIDRRANALLKALVSSETTVIRQLAQSRAEQVGYYRLLNNENFETKQIIQSITQQCAEQAKMLDSGHLLVINDTTEINFQRHQGRIRPNSGLGKVGNNKDIGCFIHAALAVDANSSDVLGLCYLKQWTRQHDEPTTLKAAHKKRAIEQKESYRWFETIQESAKSLPETARLTFIADAESDIYEVLAAPRDASVELLLRSRGDRCIVESGDKLNAYVAQQTSLGTYRISLTGDRRKKRSTRQATVEVRSAVVRLIKPPRLNSTELPETVTLTAIWVGEIPQSVPEQEEAVDWMLLTTHRVTDLESARRIIDWYIMRWNIEQLFRVLKTQGLNVEASELENGQALLRLCLLSLVAAVRVMVMVLARDGEHDQSIDAIFNPEQQQLLERINAKMTGSSRTKYNPHTPGTAAWACWLIARLGGWKGLDSERPPGPITLFRGLRRFQQLFDGWALALASG